MPAFDPARSWAILIGTSSYIADSSLADLPSVQGNISALAEVLVDTDTVGLLPDHLRVVAEPHHAIDVIQPLAEVAGKATDMLLVYYAGHGLLDMDNALHLGLATSTRHNTDVDSLAYDHLRKRIRASSAGIRVLILDCCFSGLAVDVAMGGGSVATATGQIPIAGTYTLTATAATRTALAPKGEPYTAFTGALLSILREGMPGADEELRLQDLYEGLYSRLRAAGRPLPQQAGTITASTLPVARNHAAQVVYRAGEALDPVVPGTVADAAGLLDHQTPNPRVSASDAPQVFTSPVSTALRFAGTLRTAVFANEDLLVVAGLPSIFSYEDLFLHRYRQGDGQPVYTQHILRLNESRDAVGDTRATVSIDRRHVHVQVAGRLVRCSVEDGSQQPIHEPPNQETPEADVLLADHLVWMTGGRMTVWRLADGIPIVDGIEVLTSSRVIPAVLGECRGADAVLADCSGSGILRLTRVRLRDLSLETAELAVPFSPGHPIELRGVRWGNSVLTGSNDVSLWPDRLRGPTSAQSVRLRQFVTSKPYEGHNKVHLLPSGHVMVASKYMHMMHLIDPRSNEVVGELRSLGTLIAASDRHVAIHTGSKEVAYFSLPGEANPTGIATRRPPH